MVRFAGRGHEQQRERPAVVVQASSFGLSTTIICPMSTSARAGMLRPTVVWDTEGRATQVLTEQVRAVDNSLLGPMVGRLLLDDMARISDALRIVLDLKPVAGLEL